MNEPNNQSGADRSIIALGAKGIQLTNFEELFRFSTFVHKAGFAPRGMDTPEKVFLAVQMGLEIGISPMMALQNAAVINGRPGFYGELVVAIIQAHPSFEDMIIDYSGDGEEYGCSVTIKRKGRTPRVGTFTLREAKEADLLNNPSKKDTWGKYKKDMLYWRAFARAKGIFSDVLRGFRTVEDLQDIPEERVTTGRVVEPNFTGQNGPAQSIEDRATPPTDPPKQTRSRTPRVDPPADAIAREKALERLAEMKKAMVPNNAPEPEPEHSSKDQVFKLLADAGVPQDDFLNLLTDLGLIDTTPDAVEMGHFTIGHVEERVLQLALKDWDNVITKLKGGVGV